MVLKISNKPRVLNLFIFLSACSSVFYLFVSNDQPTINKQALYLIFLIIASLVIIAEIYLGKVHKGIKHLYNQAGTINANGQQIGQTSIDEFNYISSAISKLSEKLDIQESYLDRIPAPIMVIDKEFNISYLNSSGANVLGISQEQVKGQKCYDLFKTEDCKTQKCSCFQAMNFNRISTEETIARPNGKQIPIMYTGSPIKNHKGEIIGAIEYVADISEIKNRENYLKKSTASLLEAMDKFSKGDLTIEVIPEKYDDSIGRLFVGFNNSVKALNKAMRSVLETVKDSALSASNIFSSSGQIALGTREQSIQADEVASAVEQMTTTILQTTQNANSASENSRNAGNEAKIGGISVKNTVDGMVRIAEVVKQSAKTISKLGANSDKIGEISSVIDEIADQTNLLALNAAIEAARAGEHGRGFAVVADEVRKLAERTTTATKEIALMIKQIQIDTNEAVESINQGSREAESGKQLAEEAGESLNKIIASSLRVEDEIRQVATASEEQSTAAEQISKSIVNITNVSNKSALDAQEIADAAQNLKNLTDNLDRLISNFRLVTETNYVKEKSVLIA